MSNIVAVSHNIWVNPSNIIAFQSSQNKTTGRHGITFYMAEENTFYVGYDKESEMQDVIRKLVPQVSLRHPL